MTYLLLIFITSALLIPLGIKWEIKLRIVIPWVILVAVMECISIYVIFPNLSMIYQLFIGAAQAVTVTFTVMLILFFRDPERTPPLQEKVIVSPADGTVLYVKEIRKGVFPFSVKGKKEISLKEFTEEEFIPDRGIQIGIAMNFLNVHVNRTPIEGKIVRLKRVPGRFFSLKKVSSLLENERLFTIVDGDAIRVGIVQIASRLVRRITPYVKEGDNVQIGQRLGVIRFGSQVDLLIPIGRKLRIVVRPKDEVTAGISILATY